MDIERVRDSMSSWGSTCGAGAGVDAGLAEVGLGSLGEPARGTWLPPDREAGRCVRGSGVVVGPGAAVPREARDAGRGVRAGAAGTAGLTGAGREILNSLRADAAEGRVGGVGVGPGVRGTRGSGVGVAAGAAVGLAGAGFASVPPLVAEKSPSYLLLRAAIRASKDSRLTADSCAPSE